MTAARHALPARLDLSTAADLAAALRGHAGADLTLEAGAVTHLGTPGVQVLLAAKRSWQEAGRSLTLADADPGLQEQLGQLGLALSDLTVEGTGEAAPPSVGSPPSDGAPPGDAGEAADTEASAIADAPHAGSEPEAPAPAADTDTAEDARSPSTEASALTEDAALDEADGASPNTPDPDTSHEEE